MSVHYKFKSSLDFDTVTFDGLHISVADLKKSIMQQKKIGKSADFDLQITNAQTKEVYDDDETLVPKNTSVIVARVPVSNSAKKVWERGDVPVSTQDIDPGSHVRFDKLAKTADLANAVASEDEKIKAMMTQSSQEYDVSKYVKSRSMTGPLPPNYTCYRCGKPGHWIKNCPTNNLEIKRSTGIPRSFMVPVDGPEHKGALLTSTGEFAVPLIDHEAYKEVKKEKPPFLKEPEPEPDPEPKIPEDLLCMVCRDLLQDAVLIPCCGNSFCDECVRQVLLDSENHECPECHELDISPDTLIPNRFLRNSVLNFKNETGYTRTKAIRPPPPPPPPLSVPSHPVPNEQQSIVPIQPTAMITEESEVPNIIQEEQTEKEEKEKENICDDSISEPQIIISSPHDNIVEQITECIEIEHHSDSTHEGIEIDDNQPGTPLADEPPVDLDPDLVTDEKLPTESLQNTIDSPYRSSLSIDPAHIDGHDDSSLSPRMENTSGNTIMTITTRGPKYMHSGCNNFQRSQHHMRSYNSRSHSSHDSAITHDDTALLYNTKNRGSSRNSRSSRSYGTPPRERYRQARLERLERMESQGATSRSQRSHMRLRSGRFPTPLLENAESSNYKPYIPYPQPSNSQSMPRNYQSGQPTGQSSLLSSQSRYGPQLPAHRVSIPPGYITQNLQRQHNAPSALPANYPVQPPPPGSSPLHMHGQSTPANQPPPPGVGPIILGGPPSHSNMYSYPQDAFYREPRRLKDRNRIGDPLDDFARELLEYRREQQHRPHSRHHSRSRSSSPSHSYDSSKSWSHSGSRSLSHSWSRSRSRSFSSRSRSHSRSRSRSRSFSRSSHSRSRSASRSRSRSRGRNASPRHRSKSNSPKNFVRYNVPKPSYHQKKEFPPSFFNPNYPASYAGSIPHPLPLEHYPERPRYYRDQYRVYEDFHNPFNGPRFEAHDQQRYDNKYVHDYQRFDDTQHRGRTREVGKVERGRRSESSHKMDNSSKSNADKKSKDIETKENIDIHVKTKKKEEKNKHKKHHHKSRENKKEIKYEMEHKKRDQSDDTQMSETINTQVKKTAEIEGEQKIVSTHEPKEKKHKHKKKKDTEERKKKKLMHDTSHITSSESEKPIKVKKKKVKKETEKARLKLKPVEAQIDIKYTEEKIDSQKENIESEAIIEEEIKSEPIATMDTVIEEIIENTEDIKPSEEAIEEIINDMNIVAEVPVEDHEIVQTEIIEQEKEPPLIDNVEEITEKVEQDATPEISDEKDLPEEGECLDTIVTSDDTNVPEISFELPEISKWEREELEEAEDKSPDFDESSSQKEIRASLPSDIIQRAEKAILHKALKAAIVDAPVSRERNTYRGVERKTVEKPIRSGEVTRDTVMVVVNVKDKDKTKEQTTEKEIKIKDNPEEASLQITISAEKNKRSVQTKSRSSTKEKAVENSQSKKLKLDRSKFMEKNRSDSLTKYATSDENPTDKLYTSDTSKECHTRSNSASRKKEKPVTSKNGKRFNVESEQDKTSSHDEENDKRTRHVFNKKSPSRKSRGISSNAVLVKYEHSREPSEIDRGSKLREQYLELDDKRSLNTRRVISVDERSRRKDSSHSRDYIKDSSVYHNRDRYRESEHAVRIKKERSRSRSYDSSQSTENKRSNKERKRIKSSKRDSRSSSERKQTFREKEERTKISRHVIIENRNISESNIIRNRKESIHDESKFEPNYDETSESEEHSETEIRNKKSKHIDDKQYKKHNIDVNMKVEDDQLDRERIQQENFREIHQERGEMKKRERSESTHSSSGSSPEGSILSETDKMKKRLKSDSPDSDSKQKHKRVKHKKQKKHKRKHKKRKSHKYRER